jgi:hypothetical protein
MSDFVSLSGKREKEFGCENATESIFIDGNVDW